MHMNIYAGTSGYGYREWKGKFYPEKISPDEMLRFYAERFNSVEINNTFYRMPTTKILASWADQVPSHFVFAFKAPQVITHLKQLKQVDQEISYFFRTLSVFGNKLGPVLFQFPKSFHADPLDLEDFLDLLPSEEAVRIRVPECLRLRSEHSGPSSSKGLRSLHG